MAERRPRIRQKRRKQEKGKEKKDNTMRVNGKKWKRLAKTEYQNGSKEILGESEIEGKRKAKYKKNPEDGKRIRSSEDNEMSYSDVDGGISAKAGSQPRRTP